MRMPASLSGKRAASTILVKIRGNRDSPKGRALYWYALRTQSGETVCVEGGSRHGSRRPSWSIAANQSKGRMHLKMRLCVNILNGSL